MPYNYKKKGNYKRTGNQKYVARIKNKRYSARRYSTIEKVLSSLPKEVKNKIKRFTGTRKYTNRRGAIQRRRKQMNYYKQRVLARNPRFAIKERGPRYPINKRVYSRLTLKNLLRQGMRKRYKTIQKNRSTANKVSGYIKRNVIRSKYNKFKHWMDTSPQGGAYGPSSNWFGRFDYNRRNHIKALRERGLY